MEGVGGGFFDTTTHHHPLLPFSIYPTMSKRILRLLLVAGVMAAIVGYFQFCDTNFGMPETIDPVEENEIPDSIFEEVLDTTSKAANVLPVIEAAIDQPTDYSATSLKKLLPTKTVIKTELIYRDTCFAANEETEMMLQKDKEIAALLAINAEKDQYSITLQNQNNELEQRYNKMVADYTKEMSNLTAAKLYEGLNTFPSGKVKWSAIVSEGALRNAQPTMSFITPSAIEAPRKGQHYLGLSYQLYDKLSLGGVDYNYLFKDQQFMTGGGVGLSGSAHPYFKVNVGYRLK